MDGRLWKTEILDLAIPGMELNISEMPNGQYILQITDGVTTSTARFNKL